MVGGIFYEHGHRLIASTVGFLTIILAVWTWTVEPRAGCGGSASIALGAVILQGVLGGITVLLSSCRRRSRSVTPAWRSSSSASRSASRSSRRRAGARRDPVSTTRRCADRAVDDGPGLRARSSSARRCGTSRPAWRSRTSRWRSAASRAAVLERRHRRPLRAPRRRAASSLADPRDRRARLVSPSRDAASWRGRRALLVLLVLVQVTLGAFVVWSGLQPLINTAHVVNGALVLATSLVLTLRSVRSGSRFDRRRSDARRRPSPASSRTGRRCSPAHE